MEIVVEFHELIQGLLHSRSGRHKVGYSKMVSSFLLAKSTARYGHDAGFFEHLKAVNEIGLTSISSSKAQEFFREMYSRESIHRTLNRCTGDVVHRIEHFFK